MQIGIVGAGDIGRTNARKLSAAGHDKRVANSSGLEGLHRVADESRAKAEDVHAARSIAMNRKLNSFADEQALLSVHVK